MPLIAILDDQVTNRHIFARLAASIADDVVVVTYADPLEALEGLNGKIVDLVITDFKMPHMDGAEFVRRFRELPGAEDVPVVVLTAQPAHKLRALQAGAKDFISKPFDLTEVKTRIHNMLEVRLLYKRLESYSAMLELTVRERTAELLESEHRLRRLSESAAESASEWYWEQNETGAFTQVSGPASEMVGIGMPAFLGHAHGADAEGWNEAERGLLQAKITSRVPFLDFAFSRVNADGTAQRFRISGEPMFNEACRFTGYRGVGVEVTAAT